MAAAAADGGSAVDLWNPPELSAMELGSMAKMLDPDNVKVAIRVRPFNAKEKKAKVKPCVICTDKTVHVTHKEQLKGGERSIEQDFTYDYVYDSTKEGGEQDQQRLYNELGVYVLDSAMKGFNCCVFAYGQTGSGKTYTMQGPKTNLGLIPNLCSNLFERIAGVTIPGSIEYVVSISYLEIYHERVVDLLMPKQFAKGYGGDDDGLMLRTDADGSVTVINLTSHSVTNYDELKYFMNIGNKVRKTAATVSNPDSSRSHSVFTVYIEKVVTEVTPEGKRTVKSILSKINLVDLAGSERVNNTERNIERIRETAAINQSLTALGVIIHTLAQKADYVPYRQSKLTWLLSESLGGNSKTVMIATISPADTDFVETMAALKYAAHARNIVNRATAAQPKEHVKSLKDEVRKLMFLRSGARRIMSGALPRKPDGVPEEEVPEKPSNHDDHTEELEHLLGFIQEGNGMCELIGQPLVFSLEARIIGIDRVLGIRVGQNDTSKTALWDPDDFVKRVTRKRVWLTDFWDDAKKELTVPADTHDDPFHLPMPDHLIGTFTPTLEPLTSMSDVSGPLDMVPVEDGAAGQLEYQVIPKIEGAKPDKITKLSGKPASFVVTVIKADALVSEFKCGVFVKYTVPDDWTEKPDPADDDGEPRLPTIVSTPRTGDKAESNPTFAHEATLDFVVSKELVSGLSNQPLTFEMWGHASEDTANPRKLLAIIKKLKEKLKAAEAEAEEARGRADAAEQKNADIRHKYKEKMTEHQEEMAKNEEAAEHLRHQVKKAKEMIRDRDAKLTAMEEETKTTNEAHEKKIGQYKAALKKAQEAGSTAQSLEQSLGDLSQLKGGLEAERDALKNQLASANATIASMEAQLEVLTKQAAAGAADSSAAANDLNAKMLELIKKLRAEEEQRQKVEAELVEANHAKVAATTKLEEANKELEKLRAELETLRKQVEDDEAQHKEALRKLNEELTGEKAAKEELAEDLQEKSAALTASEAKVKEVLHNMDEQEKEAAAAMQQVKNELDAEKKRLADKDHELEALIRKTDAERAAHEDLLVKNKEEIHKLLVCKEQLEAANDEKARLLEDNADRIAALLKEVATKDAEIKRLLAQLKDTGGKAGEEAHHLHQELEAAKADLDSTKQALEAAQAELDQNLKHAEEEKAALFAELNERRAQEEALKHELKEEQAHAKQLIAANNDYQKANQEFKVVLLEKSTAEANKQRAYSEMCRLYGQLQRAGQLMARKSAPAT